MKSFLKNFIFILAMTIGYLTSYGQCITSQAYVGANSVSNQNYTGRLGLVFTPVVDVMVDSLGAYDSGLDGFAPGTTITVGIVKQSDGSLVGSTLTFVNGDPGLLNNMFRMKALPSSITLETDTVYILVAVGFNASDGNHNAGTGTAVGLNDGPGILTFGANLFDPTTSFGGTFSNVDGGPTGRYHSGTFSFAADDPVITSPGNISVNQGLSCGTSIDPLFLQNNVLPMEGLPTATDNCNGPITKALLAADPDVIDGWVAGEVITINGLSISYTQDTIEHPVGVCTEPGQRKYRVRRNWVVEDEDNNTDRVRQNINIGDQFIAPNAVATLDDIVLDLDADCEVTLLATTVNGASSDNCGINDAADPSSFDVNDAPEIRIAGIGDFGTDITFDRSVFNFATSCPVQIVVELRVTDQCMNRDTVTKMINIRDIMAPVIETCVPDAEVAGCDETEVLAPQLPYSALTSTITEMQFTGLGGAVTDQCGILAITYIDSLDQSIVACPRANPVVRVLRSYIVIDSCMNADTCVQIINVNDIEDPTFDCPINMTVQTSDDGIGDCETEVNGIALSNLDDNCSDEVDFLITYEITGSTTINGMGDASGNGFNLGTNTVEYFVADCHGNIDSCEFTITVEDDEAPMIDCSMSFNMNNDPDRCSAVVCYAVEADDNCMPVQPTDVPGMTFLGSFGSSTYFISGFGSTLLWEEANTMAAELGGHLVSITSPAEQSFLEANVGLGRYWIGLRYSPSLAAFKWTSGEDVNFTDWGPGQPGFIEGDYVFTFDGQFFPLNLGNGWFDSPSLLPARYIIEFDGPRLELIDGLASGSSFPVGITPVTYRAVDAAGNADTCMLDVIVLDVQAPVITCPTVPVTQLESRQCDSILTYAEPTATDNCEAFITQIDMTGLTSGDAFPIGITELMYEAADTSGNADTCSIFIEVLEFQVAEMQCLEINLSLDELCEGMVTPEMAIGNTEIGCPDSCTFIITDLLGVEFPNKFNATQIGKTFEYSIFCGGNTCWSTVTIEDYLKPTISNCDPDTISCVEDLSVARTPIAEDNCSATEVLIEQSYEKLACDDEFVGVWTRKYIARDLAGNVSDDTCTQLVYVERTDLKGITRPDMFIGSNALNCNTFAKLPNGAPTPAVTGVPMLGLNKLYPFEQSLICNGFVDFEDEITFQADCKTRVTRTWKILEWHCDSIARISFLQYIEIVDKIAPVVTAPADFTVNVDGRNCEASVDLAAAGITDNCNTIKEVFVTTGNGKIDANGGDISLPQGVNRIIYTATDACGNVGKDTMFVTVIEEQEPIAICETFTTVSLDNNGLVWLSAKSVDDGSFDECDANITLEIRRMNDPCNISGTTLWTDQVAFCCADASAIANPMVSLRVTDSAGNSNTCMVEVEVQDKNKPKLTCFAPTRQVTCAFTYDPAQPSLSFDSLIVGGTPCLGSLMITDSIINEQLDQCRIGFIDREAVVTFDGKELGRCQQRITFVTDNPISSSLIKWPKDITITNDACTEFDLDPKDLPAGFSEPQVPDGGCNLVGFTKKDQLFPFAGNGACFKILRTWSVIDWCGRSASTADTIPEYKWVQTIYVQNDIAPTITSVDTTVMVESLSSDCSTIPVTLLASATDDCTPVNELQWEWTVTLEDGTEINGKGPDASGTYPIGSHRVDFTVLDKCGNIAKTGYDFVIVVKTAPIASCRAISTSVIMWDTLVSVSLKADLFNYDSYHNCFPTESLKFSFSSDTNDTIRTFDCDSLGRRDIELYVTDPNNNFSFCITNVVVADSFNLCKNPKLASISGKVSTSDDRELLEAEVHLMSSEDIIDMTDELGTYVFADMPLGGEYAVVPLKDGDDMNGVSTLDLVLIQRHILGIQKFEDPYKLIAADVNHDDKITASDLVALRKLILGVNSEFQNNTSWRFIDGAYTFPVQDDPWAESFNEDYFIDFLNEDMSIDFVGTKIGDVNNSVTVNARSGNVEQRSNEVVNFVLDNRIVKSGDVFDVNIGTDNSLNINGLQIALKLNGLNVIDIKQGALDINESKSYISEGDLRISYEHNNREVIPNATTLFTVTVQAKTNGLLNEMITINDSYFDAEVYVDQLKISDVAIRWNEEDNFDSQFSVAQNEPNPWQNKTSIEVNMPREGSVRLAVYDATGKRIYSANKALNQGSNIINLSNDVILSSGVMFYEIEFEGHVVRKKMFGLN